jgi:hypothetical protein
MQFEEAEEEIVRNDTLVVTRGSPVLERSGESLCQTGEPKRHWQFLHTL